MLPIRLKLDPLTHNDYADSLFYTNLEDDNTANRKNSSSGKREKQCTLYILLT